ncbi:hypothetical protein CEXT_232441 [Caerostris extrusa]|uniref:Uncharacterized protein n=1 Tax=Caerostris extrusa TaxID=172846 RepID=A0AAV4X6Q0_CAEEX|nr:hypothetical protein CEXT_232441 [Caerostris extrusa]
MEDLPRILELKKKNISKSSEVKATKNYLEYDDDPIVEKQWKKFAASTRPKNAAEFVQLARKLGQKRGFALHHLTSSSKAPIRVTDNSSTTQAGGDTLSARDPKNSRDYTSMKERSNGDRNAACGNTGKCVTRS